ncbi:hypothetical protein PIROE2DRAFT_17120 [Piromyces sp. E2]|nr:hypothetical protein PIROE2DRAFT_17120 [Piromyces sp. E2]|eukprot:OUM57784.1 hypothetical protein PIROE2DRAFT_17120 [Piromyces sp. E2]
MGFNLFKKFKRCCQNNTDNYFDNSSYKSDSKVNTNDYLKKHEVKPEVEEITINEEDSVLSNVKLSSSIINDSKITDAKLSSSIINDSKISDEKHVEINEESILSDKNINQLRQRNPRLNRFDNDVIRLSLRKSLYANNLEQDLENFLKEQQKEANKFDRKENPYTISDMRDLYDMINNLTIKG